MSAMTAALTRPIPANIIQQAAIASTPDFNLNVIRESAKDPHSSDFVLATPGPGFTLTNEECRDAIWMRLGLCAPLGHDKCEINPALDPLGLHRLGCRNAAPARTRRHDEMVSVIAKTSLAADPRAFQVVREERLADAEGSKKRPGDVALNLGDGRSLVDLTVASPFTAACQTNSRIAGSPAAAAISAYDRKLTKWRSLLDSHSLDEEQLASRFQPLAVTALGVWDERSLRWLRRFSDVCAAAAGTDGGSAFSSLMTWLSVALWKGNSRLERVLQTGDGCWAL